MSEHILFLCDCFGWYLLMLKSSIEKKKIWKNKIEKKKKENAHLHPQPAGPEPQDASPAQLPSPTACSFSPSRFASTAHGVAQRSPAAPRPRKRAPPLFSSLVADSMGPHVSALSFFIPGESKPVTNSKPNPIPGIRDFLA